MIPREIITRSIVEATSNPDIADACLKVIEIYLLLDIRQLLDAKYGVTR